MRGTMDPPQETHHLMMRFRKSTRTQDRITWIEGGGGWKQKYQVEEHVLTMRGDVDGMAEGVGWQQGDIQKPGSP